MASTYFSKGLKRSALTVALGMCFAGGVNAQSTSGAIFGKADPGQTITIVSETGLSRTIPADANGRYSAPSLPAGRYADRHGLRRPVAISVGFTVFGAALAALWPVFPILCMAALLTGGATGGALIALQR